MADAIDELGVLAERLEKAGARGGKYYRRVPTGNPKRPWRYFYTKDAYDRAQGDSAHRNGADERERRAETTGARDEALHESEPQPKKHYETRPREKREKKPEPSLPNIDNLSMDEALGRKKSKKPKKLADRVAKALKAAIDGVVADGPHASFKTVLKLEKQGLLEQAGHNMSVLTPKGRAALEEHILAVNIENGMWGKVPREYWPEAMKQKWKSEDNMTETEIPRSAILSKGLHSFCDYDNKMRPMKPDWLADYVDAFIEEAYEHERMENAHRDPNLLPAATDPGRGLAQAVFNEFMAYVPHNKNLGKAKDHLKVSVEYVEGRLRALNLLHVDSNNHEANNQAAVAGYYPTPLQLSRDAHVEAEQERNEMLGRLGLLEKSGDFVTLAPGENPLAQLQTFESDRMERFAKGYGATSQPAKIDAMCPFHGRDINKAGIESRAVHGAVCTCG